MLGVNGSFGRQQFLGGKESGFGGKWLEPGGTTKP
jgi:hypothetical protein